MKTLGESGAQRARGTTRLDREHVLDVAERIAATEGTAGLTMRRLGSELGMNHTAVYRHFRDKDELLEQVADRLLDRRAEAAPGTDWRETLRSQLRHAVGRFDVHPDLARLVALRPYTTDTLAAHMERALVTLQEVGLTLEQAARVYQLTENFVVGFGLYTSLLRHAAEEGRVPGRGAERRALGALHPDRFPNVVAAAPTLLEDDDRLFDLAIEVVLDTVERMAERQQKTER
ncbi:TetR/AcrR family transcriptional regulator [Streptomyces spongiae]|nr:TetR/AcrR family transcriptional regulator [Streptomyces spongiae]